MSEDIIKILQSARKSKGWTQSELGAKIGLPQSHISQIEAGKVDLRLSSLIEMARLLDLEPMLIPRILKPAVKSMTAGNEKHMQKPAWQVDQSEEET